ncbi:MAG TPA: CRISPR-associated protein Cas5 [Acidimicrobiales bacterium]|nr:CRISPR-associated protein Cas5 [Acidimicrobiales bacterium]
MTDVSRPAAGWFVVLDGGIVALSALATSDRAYRAARQRLPLPLPPRAALQGLLAATAAIHLAEAAVAFRMARRRGLPSAGRWAGQTLVVGFPSLLRLRAVHPG